MGALVAGAISAVVGWGVNKLTQSTFTAVVCSGLFLVAMAVLPFSIAMPQSMYNYLLKGNIAKVFEAACYILPMEDILTCVCFIILCRYANVLWGIAMRIFHFISKTVGGQ